MLTILYRDPHLIAIDKPSGLLVHRSEIDRRETRFAVQLLRDQIGQQVFPVHRLDRGTSGVLLFALDSDSARLLNQDFAAKQPAKTYLAVVRGHPADSGDIDHAITRQPDEREYVHGNAQLNAQPAFTRYRTLARCTLPYAVDRYPQSRYALLQLMPETGRRHQLRRHLKHIAHPIIGDATHGKGVHNRFFQTQFNVGRMLLHAVELSIRHPHSGEALTITAPLSGDFARLVHELGWAEVLPATWLGESGRD
ncbi:pseudouridine synthase [Vogesella indigofera]|uniref:pseudouridine synthase n=1 Tax=Vogesella indigofera TaxID=45465 RepID=UPI00234F149F|nr:pseudouridine synthase [Vogesella indigofera]MDC7698188.1 pseudouridine synthase [Vogesella indigofera]